MRLLMPVLLGRSRSPAANPAPSAGRKRGSSRKYTQGWRLRESEGLKSSSTIVLKGGDALAERFPVGARVFLRIANPDGGEDFASITR
jgi:hypothetical protein